MYAPGVDFDADASGDRYFGTAQALIDAGVIKAEHLPKATSVTFFNGVQVDGRTVKGAQFEQWMQVRIWGKSDRITRFVVTKGVTREERARRVAAHADEATPNINRPADPGLQEVQRLIHSVSAAFAEGEEVFAGGQSATVTGGYMLRRVSTEDGEFSHGNKLFNYRPGYTCRMHDSGAEYFFSAHELQSKKGGRSYLRLVGAPKASAQIGFSIRSLA
ncbi:hypothetical protein WIX39_026330 [Variovorax sp. AB1(2024)]|uniref:hypothetical protein n=1 Tax=Variovorax sp. AB1(2024) TaxID=3132214 RepID=UPI00309F3D43